MAKGIFLPVATLKMEGDDLISWLGAQTLLS